MARELAMATRGKQEPTIAELCYLAGVLDSDGCLSITKNIGLRKNPRYVFAMNVTNTSETLMIWLVEKFGGFYNHRRQMSERHKITYGWHHRNGSAFWILKLVEPHLIIKGAQARVAIQLLENWKTTQGGFASCIEDAEVERREGCYLQMKVLNRFGPVQPQRLSPLAPAHAG